MRITAEVFKPLKNKSSKIFATIREIFGGDPSIKILVNGR